VGRSRDREKSYYLTNVPLKRSVSAEKEVHGTGKISLSKSPTYPGSHLSRVYCIHFK